MVSLYILQFCTYYEVSAQLYTNPSCAGTDLPVFVRLCTDHVTDGMVEDQPESSTLHTIFAPNSRTLRPRARDPHSTHHALVGGPSPPPPGART
eukprot:3497644-Prymnesium_polylepis.1